jgi:hypothetical protein
MLSTFVKGLMCATLFGWGASSAIRLIGNDLIRRGPLSSVLWHLPGVIALILAMLLLFTHRQIVARVAFGFLLFFALLDIGVPTWTTFTHTPSPTPKDWSLFYGLLYLFPCVVAVLTPNRGSKNV